MHRLIATTALLAAWLFGCLGATPDSESAGPAPKPNIIFIFADDHATQAISAYGSVINETPSIDRLAKEGMLFENCFCTNSICAPSRAVVLTGKHSHLNGVRTNGDTFDASQQTFPALLQGAGYQTAFIGKWHLKSDPTGFDHWEVLIGQGPYYNPPMNTPRGRIEYTGYTTDVITDRAIDWLANGLDSTKPFMLMYQHKAPHRNWYPGPDHLDLYADETIPEPETLFDDYQGRASGAANQEMEIDRHMYLHYDLKVVPTEEEQANLQGPDRAWENELKRMTPEQRAAAEARYAKRTQAFHSRNLEGEALVSWKYQQYIKDYLRSIASIDDNIGRLLEWLEQNNLAENTVIVYSSDQGFFLGEHGWYDKRWMYEESLRMPLLVRWPGRIEPGSVNTDLVQNLDFAPTFLSLARATIPNDMQGQSFASRLLNPEPSQPLRDAIYYHYYEFPAVHMVPKHYGIRTDRYKLIHYYETDEWELFDLHRDPNELNSVYADPEYADVRDELTVYLDQLQIRYQDPARERLGD